MLYNSLPRYSFVGEKRTDLPSKRAWASTIQFSLKEMAEKSVARKPDGG